MFSVELLRSCLSRKQIIKLKKKIPAYKNGFIRYYNNIILYYKPTIVTTRLLSQSGTIIVCYTRLQKNGID